MIRNKLKRIGAITLSSVLTITAFPSLSLNFVMNASAETQNEFGHNTVESIDITSFASANSGEESIADDFEVQYTFTNKSKLGNVAGEVGNENHFNYIVEFFDGTGNYLSVRPDNFGWYAKDCSWKNDGSTISYGEDVQWEEYRESMKNASVKVTIKRENKKITITNDIQDNKDVSKKYKLIQTCEIKNMPDTIKMHLIGEQVSLTNIKLVDNTDRTQSVAAQEINSADIDSKYSEFFGDKYKKKHVSVHDPSVVIGYTDQLYNGTGSQTVYGTNNEAKSRKKVYFIFGSHRAFAWSVDMQNWTTFTNNINDDEQVKKLFKTGIAWSKQGDTVYDISGNMWAPDVIWNASMGKWCMYMSINGCAWNSSIALLTADTLDGDWTYIDTVVYSGFTTSDKRSYKSTDFGNVFENDSEAQTYLKAHYTRTAYTTNDGGTKCDATTWNDRYGAHAIDPCVTYDDSGNLWMSYGSWSGGIWMFKLDPATGLRDKTVKYEYKDNEMDVYMGYKLAGGVSRSGEASYIEKMDNRYYLFISYGKLTAKGGYNMRVFSSNAITGPYKDVAGNDARFGSESSVINKYAGGDGYGNTTTGERLMSYYDWHYLDKGRVAQGHNSAVVDDDEKKYLVYHTRTNDGTEGHEVRVHQLFTAENGGLVTAPFEYSGETISQSAYEIKDIVGEYTVIYQKPSVTTTSLECCKEQTIKLNKDRTVTGDYEGTWEQNSNKPYLTINIGKVVYKGVFIKQKIEGTNCETMCFTLVGNDNVTFWGTRGYSDEQKVVKDTKELLVNVPEQLNSDLELPTAGKEGSNILWESSDENVLLSTGEVQSITEDTKITLTATIKNGNYYTKKIYTTTVKANYTSDIESGLEAKYTFENGFRNEIDNSQVGEAKSLVSGTKPTIEYDAERAGNVLNQYFGFESAATTSYTEFDNPLRGKSLAGATVSFWVNRQNDDPWDALWSFLDTDNSDSKDGRVFFTPNTYLGYNGTVDGSWQWFDCNKADTTVNDILVNSWHYVTVSLGISDFGIYVDGKPVVTKSKYTKFDSNTPYGGLSSNMLKVIASADKFYLGYGSFWGSAPAYMDNVRIYGRALTAGDIGALYKAEKAETEAEKKAETQKEQTMADASIIYKSFNNDKEVASTAFVSNNAADKLSIESDSSSEHKNYVKFAPEDASGSRSAYMQFGNIILPDSYIVEFDSKLSAGNKDESQLALATSDYKAANCEQTNGKLNVNNKLKDEAYLWSLNTTNSTKWSVSGGSSAKASDEIFIDIKKDTWVHFKTTVNKADKIVKLNISDEDGHELLSKSFEMENISDVKGLFLLSGRMYGVAEFDNVRIYQPTGKYTVMMDANYAESTDKQISQEFSIDGKDTLKENSFVRDGYYFAGWSTSPNGSVEYADKQEVCNLVGEAEILILYAVWKEPTYTIIYNSGIPSDGEMTQIVKVGHEFSLFANPYKRSTFIFDGWQDTTNRGCIYKEGQKFSTDLAGNGEIIRLYAVWKFSPSSSESSDGSKPRPTVRPEIKPSITKKPSIAVPTVAPTTVSTKKPTTAPVTRPTVRPEIRPSITNKPSSIPATTEPTTAPSTKPTVAPTAEPTKAPTAAPTVALTKKPASTKKPSTKKKKMSVKKVTAKKNAKKITGTLSIMGAKVTVKVGDAKAKKATVKGKTFTFKLSKKLKKNTKIVITITKSKYYTVKKTIKAK